MYPYNGGGSMIWEHKGRMHWSCKDIKGVLIDVVKTDKGQWLFSAISAVGGTVLETSKHSHPLDAMHVAEKYRTINDAIKEEQETGSASKPSTKQASISI